MFWDRQKWLFELLAHEGHVLAGYNLYAKIALMAIFESESCPYHIASFHRNPPGLFSPICRKDLHVLLDENLICGSDFIPPENVRHSWTVTGKANEWLAHAWRMFPPSRVLEFIRRGDFQDWEVRGMALAAWLETCHEATSPEDPLPRKVLIDKLNDAGLSSPCFILPDRWADRAVDLCYILKR